MENLNKFRQELNESSLTRIWRHITGSDAAIITAFRGSNVKCTHDTDKGKVFSKSENQDRNKQLMAALLRKKYSVTSLKGIYVEGYGTDEAIEQNENSFLVVNHNNDRDFKKTISDLGELYCQDSILMIEKQGTNAYLLGTNHDWPGLGVEVSQGRFKPKTEGEFMSRKGNASFVFVKESEEISEDENNDTKVYEITGEFETWNDKSRMSKWAIASFAQPVIEYLDSRKSE